MVSNYFAKFLKRDGKFLEKSKRTNHKKNIVPTISLVLVPRANVVNVFPATTK